MCVKKLQNYQLLSQIFCVISILLGSVVFVPAEVTLDGTLGPVGPVSGPDYLVPDSVGTRSGSNLFHSFGQFNIASGESATFTNSGAPLDNVISRVTGGPSTINGALRSTIEGADFYFLNPAGVMFGPNASLDVPASFHVSTGDYVKFSDGERFYANPSVSSVLTVASPEAFGFLGPPSAGISVDRSVLQVPLGKTLSLVGGPLNAVNDPSSPDYFDYDWYFYGPNFYLLSAPGGVINLVSVASSGEVGIDQPDVSGFSNLGLIEFTNGANMSVASDMYWSGAAGNVIIRGGDMFFQNLGVPYAAEGVEAIGSPSGLVDIKGGSLHLDNASVGIFNIGEDKTGDAARIDLTGDLLMTNGSYIDSTSWWGNAGHIVIKADQILLGDDDPTTSPYSAFGFYGTINSVSDAGSMGSGGNIVLEARNIKVQNGFFVTTASAADDGWYGPGYGDAGDISVLADTLHILNKGQIVSNAYGEGNGGTVDVVAREIIISDSNRANVENNAQLSGISANTLNSSGGRILIHADSLQLLDGGQVATTLWGSGTGANIAIDVESLHISGFVIDETYDDLPYGLASVDARVFGPEATGEGGNVTISAEHLQLENAGTIRTGLFFDASGNAGNIEINAGEISIASLGQIYADSFRGTGNSGDISINAGSMSIIGTGNVPPPKPLEIFFTGVSTTTDSGRGGTITANLDGALTLIASGGIKADTQGVGAGGAIVISAESLALRDSGNINNSSTGAGDAGSITITAGNMEITGTGLDSSDQVDNAFTGLATTANDTGRGGPINITLDSTLNMTAGGVIKADTQGVGPGGSITITAHNVNITNGGSFNSSSTGSGDAGDIAISAADSLNMRHSSITTEASEEADGGNINLSVNDLLYLYFSEITSSVGGGPETTGGNIIIDPEFVVLNNSQIVANAFAGTGGNISIVADTFLADPQSLVDASSQLGISGTVDIQAAITNISGLISPLSAEFTSASALLKERCIARLREGGSYSSFVVGGRDGLPIEPGNLLPGAIY